MKLTNAKVKAATNDSGKAVWFYDDELTGFSLTVSPKGKKTFYVDAWANGRKNRQKLGSFPELTATEARNQAKQILGELAKGKEWQRKAKARKLTVGDLWESWYTNHSKPKKRTHERDKREYEAHVKPVMHHVLIADVERSHIANLLTNTQAANSIGAANKTRSLLSAMWEYAIDQEWTDTNPVRKTHKPTYEPRQRYLKESEVKAFFKAVGNLRSEIARDFILLCLWTGQRRDNVASMEWDELNLESQIWVIPKAKYKGKRAHVVPLSEPAMEILKRRHENRTQSKYVLPSRSECGYYRWPKDAWKKVLRESDIEDLRIHDLRRSLGAWMNDSGDSLRIIQQALGHANVSITAAIYTPTEVDAVRKSVDGVAARMLQAAKGGE